MVVAKKIHQPTIVLCDKVVVIREIASSKPALVLSCCAFGKDAVGKFPCSDAWLAIKFTLPALLVTPKHVRTQGVLRVTATVF